MKIKRALLLVVIFISFGIFCLKAQSAVTFTTLFSFSGTNGIEPEGQLVQAKDGCLYGTARETTLEKWGNANFGFNGHGTIFRITTNGVFSTITNFFNSSSNGGNPRAGLTIGGDGNFYGTTAGGAPGGLYQDGNVFRLSKNGEVTILASFNRDIGQHPVASLLKTKEEFFVGTTIAGGSSGLGTAYGVDTRGALKSLVVFDGTNGAIPSGNLILGKDNNIYGTTEMGGIKWLQEHNMTNEYCKNGFGTVFRMKPDGKITTLVAFNGYNGLGGTQVAQAGDGSIFGITGTGGATNTANHNEAYEWFPYSGQGTIFKISPTGEFKTLVLFNGANGKNPSSFSLGKDGNFYGATTGGGANDQGTIFRLTPNGKFTTLYSFKERGSSFPNRRITVMQGADGNLYGTAARFGVNGSGSIFRLTLE